jgi:hypothetical protein
LIAKAEIAQTKANTTIPKIHSNTFTKVGIQELVPLISSFSTTISVDSILTSGLSFVYCPQNLRRISYSSQIEQILRFTIFS